jgi:hypothetical protein
VEDGGGLFCIHDTLSPLYPYQELINVVGLQMAYDTFVRNGNQIEQVLVRSDINSLLQRVPIEVVEGNKLHPIVEDIDSFDIGEEFWATNTMSDVRELLTAEVGDRMPSIFRYREPIPICGCRSEKKGRTCFFLPVHYTETYQNQKVLDIFKNIILWLGQVTSEGFDIFLSFSIRNKGEAQEICEKAENKGLKVFMSEKDIESGDEWTEEIRNALRSSREVAILVSPDSINSKWVTIESGAAWSLKKRITPILFRCAPSQLPIILTNYQARDLHKLDLYLREVIKRRIKNK